MSVPKIEKGKTNLDMLLPISFMKEGVFTKFYVGLTNETLILPKRPYICHRLQVHGS